MSSDDRRKSQRFPFSSHLAVRRQRPVASDWAEVEATPATALDVSTGGFGFRSAQPLQVGDYIAVTLSELSVAHIEEHEVPSPGRATAKALEIFAVVRHVVEENGGYVIGAQRR